MALSEATVDSVREHLQATGFKPSHAVGLLRHYYQAGGRFDPPFPLWPKGLLEQVLLRWPLESSAPAARQVAEEARETTATVAGWSHGRVCSDADYRADCRCISQVAAPWRDFDDQERLGAT
jgi:hypothetical protein